MLQTLPAVPAALAEREETARARAALLARKQIPQDLTPAESLIHFSVQGGSALNPASFVRCMISIKLFWSDGEHSVTSVTPCISTCMLYQLIEPFSDVHMCPMCICR